MKVTPHRNLMLWLRMSGAKSHTSICLHGMYRDRRRRWEKGIHAHASESKKIVPRLAQPPPPKLTPWSNHTASFHDTDAGTERRY